MSAFPLSGTERPSGLSLHRMSRPDLAAGAAPAAPGRHRGASSAAPPPPATAATPAVEPPPLVALGLPRPAALAVDPVLAEQYYRAAVLREIRDLMTTHGLLVEDVAAAFGASPRRARA